VTDLHVLANEWRSWSAAADRSESGWQSDFPRWPELLDAARAVMMAPFDAQSRSDVELVWEASEEGEEMLEFSSKRLDNTEPWIRELARSNSADIRWQVYDTLRDGVGKQWAEGILRCGLVDADPYARRRAALALAAHRVADVEDIVKALVQEHDPYLRQAAAVLAAESLDPSLVQKTRSALTHDPAQQVRDAVAQRLKLRPDGA